MPSAVFAKIIRGDHRFIFYENIGVANFTINFIWNSNDGTHSHASAGFDNGLDFPGINVISTRFIHFLHAPNELECSIRSRTRQIAGVKPPCGIDRLFRGLRTIPIALHNKVATDLNLSSFPWRDLVSSAIADADLILLNRPTDAVRENIQIVRADGKGDGANCLGETVRATKSRTNLLQAQDKWKWGRGAAPENSLYARQIIIGKIVHRQTRLKHRGELPP